MYAPRFPTGRRPAPFGAASRPARARHLPLCALPVCRTATAVDGPHRSPLLVSLTVRACRGGGRTCEYVVVGAGAAGSARLLDRLAARPVPGQVGPRVPRGVRQGAEGAGGSPRLGEEAEEHRSSRDEAGVVRREAGGVRPPARGPPSRVRSGAVAHAGPWYSNRPAGCDLAVRTRGPRRGGRTSAGGPARPVRARTHRARVVRLPHPARGADAHGAVRGRRVPRGDRAQVQRANR